MANAIRFDGFSLLNDRQQHQTPKDFIASQWVSLGANGVCHAIDPEEHCYFRYDQQPQFKGEHNLRLGASVSSSVTFDDGNGAAYSNILAIKTRDAPKDPMIS